MSTELLIDLEDRWGHVLITPREDNMPQVRTGGFAVPTLAPHDEHLLWDWDVVAGERFHGGIKELAVHVAGIGGCQELPQAVDVRNGRLDRELDRNVHIAVVFAGLRDLVETRLRGSLAEEGRRVMELDQCLSGGLRRLKPSPEANDQ